MTLFLPFQNGEVIFTAETVAQRNGTIVAKQALKFSNITFRSEKKCKEKGNKKLLGLLYIF